MEGFEEDKTFGRTGLDGVCLAPRRFLRLQPNSTVLKREPKIKLHELKLMYRNLHSNRTVVAGATSCVTS